MRVAAGSITQDKKNAILAKNSCRSLRPWHLLSWHPTSSCSIRSIIFGLKDILTWGAFTYPVAFLVNDLTNRRFGKAAARRVVYAGFAIAVILSIWLATPRIAIASGAAFLTGQLLDIQVFDRLRRTSWWKAPFMGTVFGSALDTAISSLLHSLRVCRNRCMFGMERRLARLCRAVHERRMATVDDPRLRRFLRKDAHGSAGAGPLWRTAECAEAG